MPKIGFDVWERRLNVKSTDTCFVMMSFSSPVGNYYSAIYEPAIQKAGLPPCAR